MAGRQKKQQWWEKSLRYGSTLTVGPSVEANEMRAAQTGCRSGSDGSEGDSTSSWSRQRACVPTWGGELLLCSLGAELKCGHEHEGAMA
jgi:hypothetical protein